MIEQFPNGGATTVDLQTESPFGPDADEARSHEIVIREIERFSGRKFRRGEYSSDTLGTATADEPMFSFSFEEDGVTREQKDLSNDTATVTIDLFTGLRSATRSRTDYYVLVLDTTDATATTLATLVGYCRLDLTTEDAAERNFDIELATSP